MTASEVRELRRRLNLTQEQLAQRLGVTVSTVRRWELGTSVPSPMAQRLIAQEDTLTRCP